MLFVHSLKLVARQLILHMSFCPNIGKWMPQGHNVCGIPCSSDYIGYWLFIAKQKEHSSCFGKWFVACRALHLDTASIHHFCASVLFCQRDITVCVSSCVNDILTLWFVQAVLGATYSSLLVAFCVFCLTVESLDFFCFALCWLFFVSVDNFLVVLGWNAYYTGTNVSEQV